GRDSSSQEPPPAGQRHRRPVLARRQLDEISCDEPCAGLLVQGSSNAAEVERLVEPETEQQPFAGACLVVEHLELSRRPPPLPRELGAVRTRESRPRLCLELVARQVLRRERDRLGEVALEVGGALARDAVDEIERDVVKSGIAKKVHRLPDDIGSRASLENVE